MRRRRRRRILLVGGLVAFGAYKLSTRDADRVKEHTGTDPEELTDEELAQAMDQLGIEKQEVTSEDREQGSASPAATAPSAAEPDYLEELEKLAQLHEAGALTDEEFNAKKHQILGL
jgi:hypothetical protein